MGYIPALEFLKKASTKVKGLKREITEWENMIKNLKPRETSEYLAFERGMKGNLETLERTMKQETKRTKEKITRLVNVFIERLNEKG